MASSFPAAVPPGSPESPPARSNGSVQAQPLRLICGLLGAHSGSERVPVGRYGGEFGLEVADPLGLGLQPIEEKRDLRVVAFDISGCDRRLRGCG
jgi:hypothetical protein